MLSSGRPEETVDDEALLEARPACVALAPVIPSAQGSRAPNRLPRPDPTFVTHLLATAEQFPQTRGLRRATTADARSVYQAHQRLVPGAGTRTRQFI